MLRTLSRRSSRISVGETISDVKMLMRDHVHGDYFMAMKAVKGRMFQNQGDEVMWKVVQMEVEDLQTSQG